MAESSGFHTTAAVPAGHQVVSYTEALMDQAMTIISECHGSSGVAPDYLNKLAPSDGGANTLNVATGGAMVGGFWYYNSAVEGVTIPNAAAGTTRFDRVTLHHTGTPTFTVELTVNTGDAVNPPATPAGDVSIATVEVTDAGVLTVTDARDFADPVANSLSVSAPDSGTALSVKIAGDAEDRFNISTSGTLLWGSGAAAQDVNLYRSAANVLSTADSLVVAGNFSAAGTLTFAAGAIESADIAANAVTTAKILDANVTLGKMAANSVDSDQYVDGSIDYEHLAAGAAKFTNRQGGSATNWATPDAAPANYVPTSARMQGGAITVGAVGSTDVTFPVAFAFTPLVLVCGYNDLQGFRMAVMGTITTAGFKVAVYDGNAAQVAANIHWLAIGPV
jgi:hypothetical protein